MNLMAGLPTRNKKSYYGKFLELEFYISNLSGQWVADPPQDPKLLAAIAKAMDERLKGK